MNKKPAPLIVFIGKDGIIESDGIASHEISNPQLREVLPDIMAGIRKTIQREHENGEILRQYKAGSMGSAGFDWFMK